MFNCCFGFLNKRRIKYNAEPTENPSAAQSKSMLPQNQTFQCSKCNGKNCGYEDWTKNFDSPISGLHCDEVFPGIFASQRPSTVLIDKYNLVISFKRSIIKQIRYWRNHKSSTRR